MKIEEIEMGILAREVVAAVRMSRAQFMEVVNRTLEDYSYNVRKKVRPVAQTMTTFPLGSWIHHTRGCGCVVGEYLVAAHIVRRDDGFVNTPTVEKLLASDPDGDELVRFGEQVDNALSDYVNQSLESPGTVWAVYIED